MAVDLQNQSGRGSARTGGEAPPGASFAPVGAGQDPSRPLSQLAERLGALEQSLTMVAAEIGVAGMPRFRHVDPETIYAEAERRGRQAIEQARHGLLERIDRTDRATVASAAGLARDIAVLGRRIDEALAGLAAVRQPIEALQRHAEQQRTLSASMAALDQRLSRVAAELEARLQARLDAQTTPPVAPPAGDPFAAMVLPAGDIPGLREAIVEQLVTLLDRRNEVGEAVPLLVEQRGTEASPLVMNAAERAIVRLTRRIEKLENRAGEGPPAPRPASPRLGSRTGRSLMGRLFES